MELIEFTKLLLEAVNEPAVYNKLTQFIHQIIQIEEGDKKQEFSEEQSLSIVVGQLQAEKVQYEIDYQNAVHKIAEQEQELIQLLQEKNEVMDRLNQIRQEFEKTIQDNKQLQLQITEQDTSLKNWSYCYSNINDEFSCYLSLSEENRNCLRGIFKEETPEVFLASGVQLENIDAFWEYIKLQIMKQQYDDLEKLENLMYFFINLYNRTREFPPLKFQEVKEGEPLDVEYHIRSSDSKISGKINRVLLKGYSFTNTNTLIKRSIVRV